MKDTGGPPAAVFRNRRAYEQELRLRVLQSSDIREVSEEFDGAGREIHRALLDRPRDWLGLA